MIRILLLSLSAVVAIALGYYFGLWVLFGLFAAILATLLFSTRPEPGASGHHEDHEEQASAPHTTRADP